FPNGNGSGYVIASSDAQMLSKQFQQDADALTMEVNNLQSQSLVAPLGPPPAVGPIFSVGAAAENILDDKKFGINYSTDSGFEVDLGTEKVGFSLGQDGNVGVKVLNVGATTDGGLDLGPVSMKSNGTVSVTAPMEGKSSTGMVTRWDPAAE